MLRRLVSGLGVLLVTLLLLGLIEGGLRLAGFRVPVAASRDSLWFLPLFEPATSSDGLPVMQRPGVAVSFRRDKPANGFRVFVAKLRATDPPRSWADLPDAEAWH